MVSFFIRHQHRHLLRPFLSGKGDYELHRAWRSASIAAKAITCCDRDKEAPTPCRRLIDWAVKKGEMSFTMGREGRRAQWYSHSPPRTLRFAKLILPIDIKEPQLTLGMSSTGNVRWDGCKWSRFIKYCLLLFDWTLFFFPSHSSKNSQNAQALASECVFCKFKRRGSRRASAGCAPHRGVDQQDYVSPYILSIL